MNNPYVKKNKELKSLNPAEVGTKIKEIRKELIKLNAQIATGTIPKNPYQVRNSKKTIARLLTIQRENEIQMLSKNKIKTEDKKA